MPHQLHGSCLACGNTYAATDANLLVNGGEVANPYGTDLAALGTGLAGLTALLIDPRHEGRSFEYLCASSTFEAQVANGHFK